MATYNPTINDWVIRLTQLEDSLGRVTRHKILKPGIIEDSLRAEIRELKQRIEQTAASSFSDGVWRLW